MQLETWCWGITCVDYGIAVIIDVAKRVHESQLFLFFGEKIFWSLLLFGWLRTFTVMGLSETFPDTSSGLRELASARIHQDKRATPHVELGFGGTRHCVLYPCSNILIRLSSKIAPLI